MKNIQSTADKLKGIIPPMVTPLRESGELDLDGLAGLVEHILAGGVHGLFILGTTGEGPNLPYSVRYDVVRAVCAQVSKRVPVYVGITDTIPAESIALSQFAYEQGADAVVAAAPYYLPMAQSELLDYVERLVRQLPLPLVLYNIPTCTKIQIEPQTARRLAELPGVIGLKDSSADMRYFQMLKWTFRDRPDFKILMGTEELLAESLLLGADGGISGGANLFPRLYVELYEAALAADLRKVQRLHRLVMIVSTTIYSQGQSASSVLKGIKCALKMMGICGDAVAEPLRRFEGIQQDRIRTALAELQKLCADADGS
jgi:4-hydroxy-tetrahydrodipicolinate synthase